MRLSGIVSRLRNNCRQIVTQQLQKKFFYNVILKCFQNHCHLSKPVFSLERVTAVIANRGLVT